MSAADWQALVHDARDDLTAIGLVLTGGRGKGVWTEQSDWDGLLVVTDPAVQRWRDRDPGALDLTVIGATAFEAYAEPFTPIAWRGYDFARLSADVDRGGFQAALDRKGRLAPAAAATIAEEAIGGSLNQLDRAAKNARDEAMEAARLDLIESLSYSLTALFALERSAPALQQVARLGPGTGAPPRGLDRRARGRHRRRRDRSRPRSRLATGGGHRTVVRDGRGQVDPVELAGPSRRCPARGRPVRA